MIYYSINDSEIYLFFCKSSAQNTNNSSILCQTPVLIVIFNLKVVVGRSIGEDLL
jgi:hypothetical protein